MWVKPGSFVIIQPIQEGVKVKGRQNMACSAAFYEKPELEESDDDNDDDIPRNTYRVQAMIEISSGNDSSEDDPSDSGQSDDDSVGET
ncbi:probable RNA-binding protein EIF1AD [Coccinella septempunctata]|uniref:probable RNA-binding protein EIF1AD n=1 Tax=Coccinella septempunctata TaxID=41139 RepID=UPI001D0951F1|nr:probable RNA-binding protein EIF1AD [Coccinella septempunctata]